MRLVPLLPKHDLPLHVLARLVRRVETRVVLTTQVWLIEQRAKERLKATRRQRHTTRLLLTLIELVAIISKPVSTLRRLV
jgi:hypothetical protein